MLSQCFFFLLWMSDSPSYPQGGCVWRFEAVWNIPESWWDWSTMCSYLFKMGKKAVLKSRLWNVFNTTLLLSPSILHLGKFYGQSFKQIVHLIHASLYSHAPSFLYPFLSPWGRYLNNLIQSYTSLSCFPLVLPSCHLRAPSGWDLLLGVLLTLLGKRVKQNTFGIVEYSWEPALWEQWGNPFTKFCSTADLARAPGALQVTCVRQAGQMYLSLGDSH